MEHLPPELLCVICRDPEFAANLAATCRAINAKMPRKLFKMFDDISCVRVIPDPNGDEVSADVDGGSCCCRICFRSNIQLRMPNYILADRMYGGSNKMSAIEHCGWEKYIKGLSVYKKISSHSNGGVRNIDGLSLHTTVELINDQFRDDRATDYYMATEVSFYSGGVKRDILRGRLESLQKLIDEGIGYTLYSRVKCLSEYDNFYPVFL